LIKFPDSSEKLTKEGILNLYKPLGITSFKTVQRARHLLKAKKAGHLGTLDPMAEGVLPIALNGSTRIIQFLSGLTKEYLVELRLGIETDTQDATGTVISQKSIDHITDKDIEDAANDYIGEIEQIPPMYSAKKQNGVPLYKLARKGIEVARKPNKIIIYSLEIHERINDRIKFRVRCSSGAYMRTLCYDIGNKLDCGGHMTQLIRQEVGIFKSKNTITLEKLECLEDMEKVSNYIISNDQILSFLPELRVKTEYLDQVLNGSPLTKSVIETVPEKLTSGTNFRILDSAGFPAAIVESLFDKERYELTDRQEKVFKFKRVLTTN